MEDDFYLFSLRGLPSGVNDINFDCDEGNRLACGVDDGCLIYDVRTRRVMTTLMNRDAERDGGNITLSCFFNPSLSPSDVIVQTRDGVVRRNDYDDVIVTNSTLSFTKIAPQSKTTVFAAGSEDTGTIELFDWRSPRQKISTIKCAKSNHGMVMSLKFTSTVCNANLLICGMEDGSILLWDCFNNSSSPLSKREKVHSEPVLTLATIEAPPVADQSLQIVSAGADSFIRFLPFAADSSATVEDVATSFRSASLGKISLEESGINALAVRGDGRVLASAGWDKKVRLFSTKDKISSKPRRNNSGKEEEGGGDGDAAPAQMRKKELAIFDHHLKSVKCLAFSPVTGVLATGGEDRTVTLLKPYT